MGRRQKTWSDILNMQVGRKNDHMILYAFYKESTYFFIKRKSFHTSSLVKKIGIWIYLVPILTDVFQNMLLLVYHIRLTEWIIHALLALSPEMRKYCWLSSSLLPGSNFISAYYERETCFFVPVNHFCALLDYAPYIRA